MGKESEDCRVGMHSIVQYTSDEGDSGIKLGGANPIKTFCSIRFQNRC